MTDQATGTSALSALEAAAAVLHQRGCRGDCGMVPSGSGMPVTGCPGVPDDEELETAREMLEAATAAVKAVLAAQFADAVSAAWPVIAGAAEGWAEAPEAWREAAERWRDRFHAGLRVHAAVAPEQPGPRPLPPGDYGRVEIPGYRENEGWISQETRWGQQVAVVRDRDGQVTAEVIPGPGSRFVRLPVPPEAGPQPLTALPAGHSGREWGGYEDGQAPF